MLYQRRNGFVEAVQWWEPGDHPLVIGQSEGWAIATPEGWRRVLPGDWLVTDATGCTWPMRDELFHGIYEPVGEPLRMHASPAYPKRINDGGRSV